MQTATSERAPKARGKYIELNIPESIYLPTQVSNRRSLSPEERLLVAIFEDAVEQWRRNKPLCNIPDRRAAYRARQQCEEAKWWFYERANKWPFSFANCCDVLGWNPDDVRKAVFR